MVEYGQNFHKLRTLRWEEVFCFWYQNEAMNESWQKLAHERGYASWADWRLHGYADRFACADADWVLYEIENAPKMVGDFFGGPFRTWIERHYDQATTKSFAELATLDSIINNPTIKSMQTNFPIDKVITCLDLNGSIFVIEGMHRTCALALMNQQGIVVPSVLRFAIGKSKLVELPAVGKNG